MTEWREMSLGDVCELKRGYDLPRRAREDGSVPIVSSSGVTGYHSTAKVKAPGVVTGRYGTLGQVFYLKDDFWPLNTALYVRDFKGNDPEFVAALLTSMDLAQHDGAAAVPGLNRNQLHKLPVSVPSPDVQHRVARALRCLDDLIENNRRRVEVLEEMARAIYREWFVHFRFPGHEDASFVDSDLGPIPEGWQVQPLGDLTVNLDRHRKPLSGAKRAERPGPFPYYGAAKLIDWVDGWLFEGEHLLFAEDGSVQTAEGFPVLQLVDEQFWANNHTHILKGDGVSTRFLYFACGLTPISGYVTGAAQPKITQANLNRIPVVVGTEEIHHSFDELMNPLIDERRELDRAIAPLVKIRDLLLPKLVTGEIDISNLDLDAVMERTAV